ncbi:TusE/DsrC/DsvC family sulfur relay protein [Chloroflexota bacterium]
MWEFIVALVLAIPVIIFPVMLVWYADVSGVYGASRVVWKGRATREEEVRVVARKQPPGIAAVSEHRPPRRELGDTSAGGETAMTTVKLVAMPELDEDGHMLHPEMWTEEAAELIAEELVPGDLTEEHWRVIYHLRQYYLEFGIVPPVRKLCRDTGLSLKYIYKLFPGSLAFGIGAGLARCACKIAGIPWMSFKQYP